MRFFLVLSSFFKWFFSLFTIVKKPPEGGSYIEIFIIDHLWRRLLNPQQQ